MEGSGTSPVAVVLLADDDAFEAGYVTATLQSRGCEVRGPCSGVEHALQLAEREPAIVAAVIGQRWGEDATDALIAALRGRDIPCLLLLPVATPARAADPDTAVLVKPFASYQVADWVSGVALPRLKAMSARTVTADEPPTAITHTLRA